MLSIGQLDRRIVVQSPTYTRDDYGEETKVYATAYTLWAHVDWKASRRKEESQEQIQGTNVIAGVEKHDYLETLYELQETFVENELYELASDCQRLIYDLQINKIISDSQRR